MNMIHIHTVNAMANINAVAFVRLTEKKRILFVQGCVLCAHSHVRYGALVCGD